MSVPLNTSLTLGLGADKNACPTEGECRSRDLHVQAWKPAPQRMQLRCMCRLESLHHNICRSKSLVILPHPSPLPEGEGVRGSLQFPSLLPKGEGEERPMVRMVLARGASDGADASAAERWLLSFGGGGACACGGAGGVSDAV